MVRFPASTAFSRFALLRLVCALATYGLYLLLLNAVGYHVAYVLSYVVGIILAYVSSARLVFNEPLRLASALKFPLVYLVQFALNYVLLALLVEMLHVPASISLGISVIATIPLTYALSKWAIAGKPVDTFGNQ